MGKFKEKVMKYTNYTPIPVFDLHYICKICGKKIKTCESTAPKSCPFCHGNLEKTDKKE